MTEKEKNGLLSELIDNLCDPTFSQNETTSQNWIQRLNKIYANGYRHNYADLFYKLQPILAKDSEVATSLAENLNVLENKIALVAQENHDDANIKNTADSYKKFADHIRLEIGRYNFIKQHFVNCTSASLSSVEAPPKMDDLEGIQKQLNALSSAIDKMRPITTQAQKELDNLDAKLENNKISSITTLTIFSAVVLAFSGGITFEAGMLQGMAVASPYRLVFTIALVGFVLFNTIFALLYLVGKLSGRAISTRCRYISHEENDCAECQSCGDGYCAKPYGSVSIFCRIFHKYSYVFAINVVLLWVMYADFVVWVFRDIQVTPIIVSYIMLPAMLGAIMWLCNVLTKMIRRRRVLLACKISLIKRIVEPQVAQVPFLLNLSSVLSRALGTNNESLTDSYLKYISNERETSFFPYFKLSRKTNRFVIKNMLTPSKMSTFISRDQHWKNIRIWRELKRNFREYLKDTKHNEKQV